MKLLTKAITDTMPMLGATDGIADAPIRVKFFTPWSNWTWYATEASAIMPDGSEVPLKGADLAKAEDVRFFGFVDGFEGELGDFSLRELSAIKGPYGLRIERDRGFSLTSFGV